MRTIPFRRGRAALIGATLALILCGPRLQAQPPPASAPLVDAREIMPTSDIRPGMIATAKTVFSGTRIEEFHLEILGVLPRLRGGSDVIIGRVIDGVLIERRSGILQGMSGSPVYIGGRLIGAIALGWPFSMDPVCGITPIEDMLRVLAAQDDEQPRPGPPAPAAPVTLDGRAYDHVWVNQPSAHGGAEGAPRPTALTLEPMTTTFLASGLSPRALERLREVVGPFGAAVMQGVGGSGDFDGGDLEPGAGLGIQLVRGDFDVTALGTVTYVSGERVLALGHPLMSLGEVDLTLATTYINTILPSYSAGMKIGHAGRPVGRIAQDRMWAVAGVKGEAARSIAVAVTVADDTRPGRRSFSAEIAPQRNLAPGLAATVVLSAIDRGWEHVGEGTARIEVELHSDRQVIRRSDVNFSPADTAASVIAQVAAPMAMLLQNEFGSIPITALKVNVRVSPRRETASIENIAVQPGKIKAGDDLEVSVRLRPFKGEPVEKRLQVTLPADLPDGPLRIGVAGGRELPQLRAMLGVPGPQAFNLPQLVRIYETTEPGDELALLVALPTIGASIEGRRVPAVPGPVLQAFSEARSALIDAQRDSLKASQPTPWLIEGRRVTAIDIEGKPGAARRRPPSRRPAPDDKEQPPGDAEREEEREAAAPPFAVALAAPAEAGPAGQQDADAQRKEPEKTQERPVGREPSSWTQARRADFVSGEFDDIACSEDGVLTLAPVRRSVAQFREPIVTALLARDGVIYAATAPGGVVRKLSAEGKVLQAWDADAALVTALALGADGVLLAGTAPGGRVIALGDDGRVRDYFDTGQQAVWALAPGPDGRVFVGTGSGARVFAVTGPGQGRLLAALPATAVYSLAAADAVVYAGTGAAGVLYEVDPSGQVRAAFDSDQEAITALAIGANAAVYVGTSPQPRVFALRAGRAEKILEADGDGVAALAVAADGLLYAVTAEDGIVYEIDPGQRKSRLLRKPEQGQALVVALDHQGGIVAADSNPAGLTRLGPDLAARGVFTSTPQQAAPGTRWGALTAAAQGQDATAVFQTRSGDSADPDDHWSVWSAPADIGSAADILSPPAAYLQYRISLAGAGSRVRDIHISYAPPNRPPTVTISAPRPAERVRKAVDVKWKGEDPDKDRLTYHLWLSADGGATWQELKRDIEGSLYSWDTKNLSDGPYLLRLVASDRRSNPDAPLEAEAQRLAWVDNTPPALLILRHTVSAPGKGKVMVRGAASDELSPLAGVDYRVDDGPWQAAIVDGPVGRRQASFAIEADEVKPGERRIQVRVFDQAGNTAQDEVRVKVE